MKRTMKYLALAAALTVFAVPAFAQKQECTDENKTKWYQTFLDNRKGDQKVAYDAAKLYLDNCPADPNDAQAKYMREKLSRREKLMGPLPSSISSKTIKPEVSDQIKYSKEILASDTDKPAVIIIMGVAGCMTLTFSWIRPKRRRRRWQSKPASRSLRCFEGRRSVIWVVPSLQSQIKQRDHYFIKAARYEGDRKRTRAL